MSDQTTASEAIILIVDDLMFLPKLENMLTRLGYRPLPVSNDTELTRAINTAPVLAIVDLFSQSLDWRGLVRFLKGPDKKGDHIPILGFGPHVDLALREEALEVGCDAVVGRGAIAGQLPQLVKKHRWTIDTSPCDRQPPPLLLEGIKLFNEREFFECHEVIEEAWIAEKEPVRIMYQGILQIGVACYHVQQKNWRGAMKVLDRGIPKTERYAPRCMGIDLAKLILDAQAIRRELLRLGSEWEGDFDTTLFPTIEVADSPA